ncbi:hypothetical protein BKA93DRAFT_723014 [Sparassis latifolia]
MSFEHASVTKGLMLGIALTSISAGIFDVKHYLHLQLVPHISKHHQQYWRLFTHHIACANSSDLFLVELLLFNVGVQIERAFGSFKFASFILVSAVVSTISTFLSLIILHTSKYLGSSFNHIPCGPLAIIFSVIYQYRRLVPPAYQFRVFGVALDDKIWVYAVAALLSISHLPSTLLLAVLGLLSGYVYRSDMFQLKSWRIPQSVHKLVLYYVKPLMGEGGPVRRTNRVFPAARQRSRANGLQGVDNDEVVTTARESPTSGSTRRNTTDADLTATAGGRASGPNAGTGGVMRQWMSEIAGSTQPSAGGGGTVRAPSEAEIQMLVGMFPDVGRDVILGVLQRR